VTWGQRVGLGDLRRRGAPADPLHHLALVLELESSQLLEGGARRLHRLALVAQVSQEVREEEGAEAMVQGGEVHLAHAALSRGWADPSRQVMSSVAPQGFS
jgi:transcriptional antiterminator Rof (Rho-off)